jgi:hypothetical protein
VHAVKGLEDDTNAVWSAEIGRLLSSSTFRHAEQLRQLLVYLAERSARGEAHSLKEYTVGVDALGKPATYDPRKDATVRIQTGRLRAKLDDYYRSEGIANPARVRLPKGGFRLELERIEVPELAPPTHSRTGARKRSLVAAHLATALVAFVLGALAWKTLATAEQPLDRWSDPMKEFWAPFLSASEPPILVTGPNLFFYMDGLVVRDWLVNTPAEAGTDPRLRKIQQLAGVSELLPLPIYTGWGEARGLFLMSRLFFGAGRELQLRDSRDLSWSDFKERNVILLGSSKSIPQLSSLPDLGTELALAATTDGIRPTNGSGRAYTSTRDLKTLHLQEAFGLITRIPGTRGRGEVIELSSPDTDGALAAAEFVANPDHLRDLQVRLGPSAFGQPFQVVVRATIRNQVPVHIRYETHQVLRAEGTPAK